MKPMTIIATVAMAVVYLAIRTTSASDATVFFIFASVIVVLPYVAGPILIRFKQRHSVHPQLEPKAPQDLPGEVSEFFQRATQDLTGEGFTVWPAFTHRAQNATAHLKLFLNREVGDSIIATAIYSNAKGVERLRTKNLIITTKLDDGQRYVTSNTQVRGIFRNPQGQHGLFLPQIRDNSQLYKIHRAWLAKAAPAGQRILPAKGREVDAIAEEMTGNLDRQVELGFFYIDRVSDSYRPTWKGAVLMTWKVCWPVKQIRKVYRARKDKEIVHSLGF